MLSEAVTEWGSVHLVRLAFPLTGALRVHPQIQVQVIRTDSRMIRIDGPEPHEEQRAEESERRSREPHEWDVQTPDWEPLVCPVLGRRRGFMNTSNCTNVVKRWKKCEPCDPRPSPLWMKSSRTGQDRTAKRWMLTWRRFSSVRLVWQLSHDLESDEAPLSCFSMQSLLGKQVELNIWPCLFVLWGAPGLSFTDRGPDISADFWPSHRAGHGPPCEMNERPPNSARLSNTPFIHSALIYEDWSSLAWFCWLSFSESSVSASLLL